MAEFNEHWPYDRRDGGLADHLDDAYQLIRIPAEIWPALQSRLKIVRCFVVAWLQAVRATFPDHNLMELLHRKPGLFPAYLHAHKGDGCVQEHLILSENGDILVVDGYYERAESREEDRAIELAVLRACRFQHGFASEGMLCNEPPIPLRVLDFLEAADILRLSLACKSMHWAAHLLLQREASEPSGYGAGKMTGIGKQMTCFEMLCVQAVFALTFPPNYTEPQAWPNDSILQLCGKEAVRYSILAKLPVPWHRHISLYEPQRILRAIRLGSLMHGTPEAIPLWQGELVFPKCSTEDEPCNTSVVWTCDCRPGRSPMYSLTHSMWGLRSQIFEYPSYPQAFLLEEPQLRLVLMEIASQLAGDVDHAPTLMAMDLVVRAAIRNGEAVLVRKWICDDDF